jgi:hypothetical protein
MTVGVDRKDRQIPSGQRSQTKMSSWLTMTMLEQMPRCIGWAGDRALKFAALQFRCIYRASRAVTPNRPVGTTGLCRRISPGKELRDQ